jgi:hypothetical protein
MLAPSVESQSDTSTNGAVCSIGVAPTETDRARPQWRRRSRHTLALVRDGGYSMSNGPFCRSPTVIRRVAAETAVHLFSLREPDDIVMLRGEDMRWRGPILAVTVWILSCWTLRASLADFPYLHDRTASTLYGPAYRALFQGNAAVPAWIQAYNATSKGIETPGSRVFYDDTLFEKYKVCASQSCDTGYLVVLFLPGGRQAWAISILDGKQQFFGDPDPVTEQYLIAAAKQPSSQ